MADSPRRFGSVNDARAYSGISRSELYEKAAEHPGLFRKWDAKTLVDFAVLDALLDAMPKAMIKPKAKPAPADRVA